jgi:two-component system phosphate regulon sensor histidine kinase PhoR
METKTTDNKTQVLEKLLNEARTEADACRKRMKRLEKIILSTRLIMGHELKKPTTAIAGYLDLVCEDLDESGELTTLAYAHKARNECELLKELNSFYLELLKVDECDDLLGRAPVDIAAMIADVVGHIPSKLDAQRRVSINVAPGAGRVDINLNALKLIVLNLIENALLYSQKDTPVRVLVERLEEKRGMQGGKFIRFRVKDDGVGIPEEYLKKIFSPFVRLRDDVAEGSGLGLTLVRSLVELNDGEVIIRSALGKGTTVYVTIPSLVDGGGEPPELR